MHSVSPELYNQYKDIILNHSLAVQRYQGTQQDTTSACLTDKQIAEKLGLDEKDVREIRCVAEVDSIPLETYLEAEQFKKDHCHQFLGESAK